ncbi:MAG: M24 family metallopeptidase [Mycoplasmataceae bacterium]|nr:M24 family metallopeptidase [Mycoplasmataceae bacterium]
MEISKNLANLIIKGSVYISNPIDVYYLTNFKSTNMQLIYVDKKWFALTDDRYFANAKKAIKEMEVINVSVKNWFKPITKLLADQFVFIDAKTTTIEQLENIKTSLKRHRIKVKTIIFPPLRMVKGQSEIDDAESVVFLTDQIFDKIKKYVKVGKTERDIADYINKLICEAKNVKESFSPIIAAGKNGANPHNQPSSYKIKKRDFITIDFGLFYQRGCSDLTRSFIVKGKPTPKQKEVFDICLNALNLATSSIKPGIKAAQIDKIAREYIESKGYGKYFNHALGHGIGLEIHEAPLISKNDQTILEKGMIITIEPGIYIDNEFGIRLENDILVTANGYRILNRSKISLKK